MERGGLLYRCAGASTWSDERCGEQVVAINFNDALCKCVTAVPDPINSFNGKPHTQSGARLKIAPFVKMLRKGDARCI